MPPRRKPVDPSAVVTYRRVSTEEQGDSGAGLDAQAEKMRLAVAARPGWHVVAELHDVASGKSTEGREGLAEALRMVRTGEAGTLMVAKLDRLSRSLSDFAAITDEATHLGWNLTALDLGLDLSTPTGKAMAGMVAVFAQWERETIGQRTSDALRALQRGGVVLGRPATIPVEVVARIVAERAGGRSYRLVADGLNADQVPTAQGGNKWHASTVRAVALSQLAQHVVAA
jgi:DNA invertase Pin-like site-specific DNA recombinase